MTHPKRPALVGSLACLVLASAACGLVVKDPFADPKPRVPTGVMLSRAEALQDLDFLGRTLEQMHPAPYRFHSRELIEAERRSLVDTMPESMTRIDLCRRASRLMAALDEGHTGVRCEQLTTQEWRRAAIASPPETQTMRMFPPHMVLDDQQHLIVQWPMFVPGLESGDRLLRINGQDADALLAAWAREVSHDTEAGRRARLAWTYRIQLALHDISAPYRIEVVAPGGGAREIVIPGDPVNYQFSEWPRPSVAPSTPAPATSRGTATPPATTTQTGVASDELKTPFFKYRTIAPGIAYMEFTSFFDGLETDLHFKRAVNQMFARVGSNRPRVLLIDVRDNDGGSDTIADELLRHITEKPFRLVASTQIRRSKEARDYFDSIIRIPFRWMRLLSLVPETRDYFTGPDGSLAEPDTRPVRSYKRAEPFFDGPVCVLTGPFTFSAAAEFADAIKTYQLASIIGEETGGRPNDFGNSFPVVLPHSGLVVRIATVVAVRASGDAADPSPVIPDIIVRRTATDIRNGFDPVLERAKSCPSRSVR